ncbi:MAG: hypothetical protein HKN95_00400 [Acidimicrobiia bacterium]|nr:hypothetical protein [Acidimicrobiia bacterium]
MASPVVHIEVRGLEEPSLQAFYQDIFGWFREEGLSVDGYSVAEIGGGQLTAAIGQTPEWTARECTFFIQVDDIDNTLSRIEQAGGKRLMPRTVSSEDFPAKHIRIFTKFVDPAGNVLGLVEAPRA